MGVEAGRAAPAKAQGQEGAVLWRHLGECSDAAEGGLSPLANAKPRHLARDGQVLVCGLVSLNCDQEVISHGASARVQW